MQPIATRVYRYRWIVLIVFALMAAANQMAWITFAPITQDAASFYHVSDLAIGLLSVSFMVVYIVVSLPASWLIDTYGFRPAVGLGALLTAGFALLRGLAGASYGTALACQIGIAIGQPLILNAVTKVAARWFPIEERATASGLGTLGMYLGILAGLALTPVLAGRYGIPGMLQVYGVLASLAAIAFLALARERPATPPEPSGHEARSLAIEGLGQILRQRDFRLLMVVFFVGLGVFNGVTTWIEEILAPRGFSAAQAGITGALMIAGGIVGAVVLPLLSDHYRRRVPFISLALVGGILSLVGLTVATSYGLVLASAVGLGFCLLSAGPVGFQYGAEITYPAPEGTSNGMMLMMGQVSGIIFILAMDSLKDPVTGAMTLPLLALVALVVLSLLASLRLRESSLIATAGPLRDNVARLS